MISRVTSDLVNNVMFSDTAEEVRDILNIPPLNKIPILNGGELDFEVMPSGIKSLPNSVDDINNTLIQGFESCNNLTDLRNKNVTNIGDVSLRKQISVLSHTIIGDGGGGIFSWDSSSTNDDNGGTVIKPNYVNDSSPGRWIRDCNPLNLRCEWFGLWPLVDATEAIQRCLDSLPTIVPAGTPGWVTESGRISRKGRVTLPPGRKIVSGTIYQSWGTVVEFLDSGIHGACVLDLADGTWTNPNDPHWMWVVDNLVNGDNNSFGTKIINMNLIGRGCPSGFNGTGSNPNPSNMGAKGLLFIGAEHTQLVNFIAEDFNLNMVYLQGPQIIDRIGLGDCNTGPMIIISNGNTAQNAVMNLGHWNPNNITYEVGGVSRKIPALLCINCTGWFLPSIIGEISSPTCEVIHFQGGAGNEVGPITFGNNPGYTLIREYGGAYANAYGSHASYGFVYHLVAESLSPMDGASGAFEEQKIPTGAMGAGPTRYTGSQIISHLRAWREVTVKGDGSYSPKIFIDSLNGGTAQIAFLHNEQGVMQFATSNPANGFVWRHFADDGRLDLYRGNDTVGFSFNQNGNFSSSNSVTSLSANFSNIVLSMGPFANDAAAAAAGVPINSLYRSLSGQTRWRVS